MDLRDKVALVTGAARRIGSEIALDLASGGADVVVHYGASAEAAAETVARVEGLGGRAWAVSADLSETEGVERLFDTVLKKAARLDVLVNSAASFDSQPFSEVEAEDWDRTLAVNLRAPFLCMQRAAKLMGGGDDGSGGAIVNLADLSGVTPWPGFAVHGTSKAGLIFLTQAAALELGPSVRVNAVVPGAILPPPGTSPEDGRWTHRGSRLPLRRTGAPRHVAGAVRFLIENDFVTGAVIPVDGGERLLGREDA